MRILLYSAVKSISIHFPEDFYKYIDDAETDPTDKILKRKSLCV